MMHKLVSIIVPMYNAEKYVGRCLRSLSSQNFHSYDYEVIIVDDGSTDNSVQIASQFISPTTDKIKLIKQPLNKGLPSALNLGIRHSIGKYILRVDSDDYVSRYFISSLFIALETNPEFGAISCDYYEVDESEKIRRRCFSKDEPIGCGIIFRKKLMFEAGLYNEEFMANEEKEFLQRFTEKFAIDHLKIPLYRYRKHASNMTNNLKKMEYFNLKLKMNK